MIKWLRDKWWARQRATDVRILWPACKKITPDIEHARAAFAVHAFHDDCWVRHYGVDRLCEVIDELK